MPSATPAETLPAHWYHEPGRFGAEREAIFARSWLLLAHEQELSRPGDALADCLAGWPVFVRRGRDGELRAFHDVCRHRAGPLVGPTGEGPAEPRSLPVLRCRYHGWVYGDDGALERTPDFFEGGAEGAASQAAEGGLWPLRVACWRGLVFVCLDAGAEPLEQALGRLPALTDDLDLARFRLHSRAAHVLRCNWKAYVENYLEGYHIPYVHPRLHREVDVKSYRVEAVDRVVTHHAEPRPRVSEPVYDGLWAWLPPGLALNVYGDGLSLERMMPMGPGRMRIDYLFLFAEGADPARIEADLAMCREVTDEDRQICEAVQRNLEAGVYQRGRLSPRHEQGVAWFQRWVRERLAGDPGG